MCVGIHRDDPKDFSSIFLKLLKLFIDVHSISQTHVAPGVFRRQR